MKASSKRNILIGFTVLVSIFLLYWGIEYLKGANIFKPSNFYYAQFDKIDALTVSSPVNVNGFKVGQIREINYDYSTNKIIVEMSLDKEMKIPEGSTVSMVASMLGNAVLDITLSQAKTYYKVGATIPTVTQESLMDKVGNDLMPQVTMMVPKIDSLLSNVNHITGNPAIYTSVSRLDKITAELAKSSKELSKLMARLNSTVPAMANHVDGVVTNMDGLTTDLKKTSENLNDLTYSLKNMPLDSTMNRINATLANIQNLSAQLNNKNSSLGMLLNDQQLYNNANGAIASLDSLLQDIKKNPKRYITIKVF